MTFCGGGPRCRRFWHVGAVEVATSFGGIKVPQVPSPQQGVIDMWWKRVAKEFKGHSCPSTPLPSSPFHTTLAHAQNVFPWLGPDRFGNAPAQFRAFWDSTGKLWMTGALVGKPVTLFTSTGSQGGGTESTILSGTPCGVGHGCFMCVRAT